MFGHFTTLCMKMLRQSCRHRHVFLWILSILEQLFLQNASTKQTASKTIYSGHTDTEIFSKKTRKRNLNLKKFIQQTLTIMEALVDIHSWPVFFQVCLKQTYFFKDIFLFGGFL